MLSRIRCWKKKKDEEQQSRACICDNYSKRIPYIEVSSYKALTYSGIARRELSVIGELCQKPPARAAGAYEHTRVTLDGARSQKRA